MASHRLSLFAARPVSRSFEDLARSLHAVPLEVSSISAAAAASSHTPTLVSPPSPPTTVPDASFDSQLYFASGPSVPLSNRTGRHLLYSSVLESTQNTLLESAASADAGIVCVA